MDGLPDFPLPVPTLKRVLCIIDSVGPASKRPCPPEGELVPAPTPPPAPAPVQAPWGLAEPLPMPICVRATAASSGLGAGPIPMPVCVEEPASASGLGAGSITMPVCVREPASASGLGAEPTPMPVCVREALVRAPDIGPSPMRAPKPTRPSKPELSVLPTRARVQRNPGPAAGAGGETILRPSALPRWIIVRQENLVALGQKIVQVGKDGQGYKIVSLCAEGHLLETRHKLLDKNNAAYKRGCEICRGLQVCELKPRIARGAGWEAAAPEPPDARLADRIALVRAAVDAHGFDLLQLSWAPEIHLRVMVLLCRGAGGKHVLSRTSRRKKGILRSTASLGRGCPYC